MTKSAFDTGFNKRIENNNNLSMQHQLGEPLSKMGMPLGVTANRSFSNRGSDLSFHEKTSSNGYVPLPSSHVVGERDLASKNNGTVSKLITVQDGRSGSPQY